MDGVKNLPLTLKEELLKVYRICETNDIVFMAFFGSFVEGKLKRGSDVDILIEFEKGKEKSLIGLVKLKFKLEKIFKRKIDLVTTAALSPYIKDSILKRMKVIYEKR